MHQLQMANNVEYMQRCQSKQLSSQQSFYHSDNVEESQQDLNQMNQLQFLTQKKQQIQRGLFPQQQFGYQSDQHDAQQQPDTNNPLLQFQNLLQKLEQKKLLQQHQQQQTQQQLRAMFSQQIQMQIPATGLHDGTNLMQQQQQKQQPQQQQHQCMYPISLN